MKFLENTLRKDSWAFGAFLAIILPAITLFFLYYLFLAGTSMFNTRAFETEKFYLLSLSSNLLLMRYYLVSVKLFKTGKSIFITTFILIIMFFVFQH